MPGTPGVIRDVLSGVITNLTGCHLSPRVWCHLGDGSIVLGLCDFLLVLESLPLLTSFCGFSSLFFIASVCRLVPELSIPWLPGPWLSSCVVSSFLWLLSDRGSCLTTFTLFCPRSESVLSLPLGALTRSVTRRRRKQYGACILR